MNESFSIDQLAWEEFNNKKYVAEAFGYTATAALAHSSIDGAHDDDEIVRLSNRWMIVEIEIRRERCNGVVVVSIMAWVVVSRITLDAGR